MKTHRRNDTLDAMLMGCWFVLALATSVAGMRWPAPVDRFLAGAGSVCTHALSAAVGHALPCSDRKHRSA